MKLFKNLVGAVAETLKQIFTENRYADKAIERLFKQNPKWGSRDRKFVAEAVYDIVRNFRLFAELAGSEKNFWFITGVWITLKDYEIPEWPEFKHLDKDAVLKHKDRLKNNLPVFESYPDWLWNLCATELGEDTWIKQSVALNQPAPVVLRVNTLKANSARLEEEFKIQNIDISKIALSQQAYQLVKRENLFQNRLFKEGWFEIQDAGSQAIGEFVSPLPTDLVVDACAGAGGKSLHLAALMGNKGKVISMDVEAWKLDELKKRARRAGAFNIETRLIEGSKTIKRLEEKADRVLLDVPCSGLGVIKRNPDTKWKLSPESILQTRKLQQQILSEYSAMVKPGGHLVYSTCSILPSENRQQVDEFLNHNTGFEFVKDKNILPSEGYDGFYMCELRRK